MVSGTPVQHIKEHKKVSDEIDDLYMDTIYAATGLQTYLVEKKGNRREKFLFFYSSFHGLFMHTRYMQEMIKGVGISSDQMKEIEEWFRDVTRKENRKTPHRIIQKGLDLFSVYQSTLVKSGVVSASTK